MCNMYVKAAAMKCLVVGSDMDNSEPILALTVAALIESLSVNLKFVARKSGDLKELNAVSLP